MVTVLLDMISTAGVSATLVAVDDADPAFVKLLFRLQAPGHHPRDAEFGREGKENRAEILDLCEGLRQMLALQGFTDDEEVVAYEVN